MLGPAPTRRRKQPASFTSVSASCGDESILRSAYSWELTGLVEVVEVQCTIVVEGEVESAEATVETAIAVAMAVGATEAVQVLVHERSPLRERVKGIQQS